MDGVTFQQKGLDGRYAGSTEGVEDCVAQLGVSLDISAHDVGWATRKVGMHAVVACALLSRGRDRLNYWADARAAHLSPHVLRQRGKSDDVNVGRSMCKVMIHA